MVAAPGLLAQDSTGQIVGSVKTKTGEALAGAEVRISSPSLQGVRLVVTDQGGAFRAPLLPPGIYTLTTSKSGFVGGKVENVGLGLGQVLRQDLLMSTVQAATAVVEVVASAASVDKTDVKASTNVTSEMMDVLPRTTRGMNTVAQLAPGVTLNTANGVNRVQIRGGQGTGNRFLLNGSDISDNAFGTTDGRQFFVDDSVAETQVIQSPVNARYGGFTGGVINAVTKTGSNEFSGIIRANINRTSWTALAPLGQRPLSSSQPNPGTDDMSRTYAVWMGGPIVKDRLWFAVSTKLDPVSYFPTNYFPTSAGRLDPAAQGGGTALTGDGSNSPAYTTGAFGSYLRTQTNQFYEFKLTGAINENHTVELSGSRNVTSDFTRNFTSSTANGGYFDPKVLGNGQQTYEYSSLSYRGLLSNAANLEARYSKKKQTFASGGLPEDGDPIFPRYSTGLRYQFNNGIFNAKDGGDHRDIGTYIANLQWFSPSTALGTHQVDIGFEILRQERQAANDQAPNNRRFYVWGRNADGTYRAAGAATSATADARNFTSLYFSDKGTAKTNLDAFYLNDTWTLTSKWQVMGGVRFDKVSASDTLGSKTISSSQTSPRVKMTYDLKGDQSWLASISFARYTGKLQDGFANQFTLAGNPIQENYGWLGAANTALTTAQVTNLANWNVSLAGLQSVSSPLVNTINPSTKAPYSDEVSMGLRRTYTDGSFLGFTYSERKSKHFFNDFSTVGGEVLVPLRATAGSSRVIATQWANDDRLTRFYKSMEVEFLQKLDARWSLGGNYTYSILKGNSEGSEGQASTLAVSGDVIGDFESVHVANGRDASFYAPEGFLQGDRTHKAAFHLDYMVKSAQGASLNASLLFNYQSGGTYSLTRANYFELSAAATAAGSTIVSQYANFLADQYTRYFGPRGIGRYDDTYNFDLKVGLDVPVARKLHYFLEVTAFNVFNHWQRTTYSQSSVAGDSSFATNGAKSGFWGTPWTATPGNTTGYGTYGFGDYAGGRSVVVSTGFKW